MLIGAAAVVLRSNDPAPSPTATISFSEQTDLEVEAGLTIDLPLESSTEAGLAIVTVVSAAGAELVEIDVSGGRDFLRVGPPHTTRSGVVTVMASDNGAVQTRSINVRPASGLRTMDINVGPTTIDAGGTAMVVGLMTDSWGNPVLDGSEVQLTVTNGNNAQTIVDLRTRIGLAVVDVADASLDNDRFDLSMSGDTISDASAFSSVVTVRVQPSRPAPFALVVEDDQRLRADGRTRVSVTSTALADASGQPLSDGTHVVLDVEGVNGRSLVIGEVRNGIVHASFVAPDVPGSLSIIATVAERTSPSLDVAFEPAVTSVPVEFRVVDGVRQLAIGPVIGPEGGVLPDGTPVVVGERVVGLVDGRASFELQAGAPIPVVSVLGVVGAVS